VTPDWYPFVGPRQGLEGYADACGGSGHGFKLGPAIGRHLARWLVRGEVDPDFARLGYDRIARGETFVQAYGGNRG
jgi:glycine/D-amino acid oxidase-like deaminating enzyme